MNDLKNMNFDELQEMRAQIDVELKRRQAKENRMHGEKFLKLLVHMESISLILSVKNGIIEILIINGSYGMDVGVGQNGLRNGWRVVMRLKN